MWLCPGLPTVADTDAARHSTSHTHVRRHPNLPAVPRSHLLETRSKRLPYRLRL